MKEANDLVINEDLWTVMDAFDLERKNYWECYSSLTEKLREWVRSQTKLFRRKFLEDQASKMELWLRLVETLE